LLVARCLSQGASAASPAPRRTSQPSLPSQPSQPNQSSQLSLRLHSAKITGPRLAQFKSPDCGPAAMSLQDRRLAADGTAYTYLEFVQWYGAHAGQMWVTSEARTRNHTPQSSEFEDCCSVAAATEHSESFSIAADVLPALEPQPAATRRCSTQADFVQTHDVRSWGCRDATEHSALGNPTETQGSSSGSNEPRTAVKTICVNDLSRDATEHSPMEDAYSRWVALQISMATDERWQENTTEPQASSAACIETCTAVQSDCVGDQPRDATEHSPWEKALPAHAGNTFFVPQDAHEHALVLMPASSTASPQATGPLLQCVDCERPLCGTEDLAFFWRANKQGGVEVHLMLKPENKEPATFIRSPVTEKGAMTSWQCACGFKFGDTRAVAVRKAAMTAFKSSSVMLCGQRFTGHKSKWPLIYNQPPFNVIEVRTRDTFFGPTPASSSAS
jgi:hypothetical protein